MNWDVKTNVGGWVKQFCQNILLKFCSDVSEHFSHNDYACNSIDIHPWIDPLR